MSKELPKVVILGGGTGTYTLLRGLRDRDIHVTAVMTMVDDGGSNRVVRDEFGLLPTSGIRQAMVALSREPSLMRELFTYRFHKGEGIAGMTFGNLFLAAMADILGSQEEAIRKTSELLQIKGTILPISYNDVRLVAVYEDGSEVVGEHRIDEPAHDGRIHITSLRTQPQAEISSKAQDAIHSADMIIMGPGDLFTNTIANLIINGSVEALLESKALVIFIMNLMTKYGETYNYTASDFLIELGKYFPIARLNYVLLNNRMDLSDEELRKYGIEHSVPVRDDLGTVNLPSTLQIVRAPLLSDEVIHGQKGDLVKRSVLRHDPEKLGNTIMRLLANDHI